MSDELERLRADLEVLERYYGDNCCGPNKAILTLNDKIARLEAEADPWREARNWIEGWRKSDYNAQVVAFFDHLTAVNDRLAAKVAVVNPDYLNDFSPPKCEIAETRSVKYTEAGPLDPRDVSAELDDVDDDPIFDPKRTVATVAKMLVDQGEEQLAGVLVQILGSGVPYEVEGGGGA